jgi:hypothetical protein
VGAGAEIGDGADMETKASTLRHPREISTFV